MSSHPLTFPVRSTVHRLGAELEAGQGDLASAVAQLVDYNPGLRQAEAKRMLRQWRTARNAFSRPATLRDLHQLLSERLAAGEGDRLIKLARNAGGDRFEFLELEPIEPGTKPVILWPMD